MKQFVRLLIAMTLLHAAVFGSSVWAQTVVVSVANGAQLRATPVPTATVLMTLVTGTLLEVLEVSPAGYTWVRTVDNAEGWIASSAISERDAALAATPAADGATGTTPLPTLVPTLAPELDSADSIDQPAASASPPPLILLSEPNSTAATTEQSAAVPAVQKTVSVVNSASADPAPTLPDSVLAATDESSTARIDALQKELATLRESNRELRDLTARNWFITGAAVIMAGFFTGFVLAKLQRRKKSWIG